MSERGAESSRIAAGAAEVVRAAIDLALDRVESRIRELSRGLAGAEGDLRPGAVADLRSGLASAAGALGWDLVLDAARAAIDEVQAAHEDASDEAFAAMVEVVAGAIDDLARVPDDLSGLLVRELDAVVAEGASPAAIVERLSDAASAHLSAAGTDFATSLMGLHREGTLGEMRAGGLDLFVYDGPDDEVIRPFCADLVDKVTTEQDLDEMDNGQGLRPTSRYGGGYNCRHVPAPIPVEEARTLPPGSVVGFLARRIVAGALGPNEARFQLEHLGELTEGGVVRRRR